MPDRRVVIYPFLKFEFLHLVMSRKIEDANFGIFDTSLMTDEKHFKIIENCQSSYSSYLKQNSAIKAVKTLVTKQNGNNDKKT